MKSSEFHRIIKKNGWRFMKAEGSHYISEKGGRNYPVPFHGTREMGEGLRKKIMKDTSLKR